MNFRTTLIIIILFALSTIGYFLFRGTNSEERSDKNEAPKISEVYGLTIDEVRRIRLSFKDAVYQPLSLAKDDNGDWQLTEPVTTYANEPKVSEMLGDFLNKRIKRTIEVANLSQYALNQPNIRIDLWTENESPFKSFLIGTKTVNYSVYAKEASESHIFLIESSALQDLTKSPADLRTRNALTFDPEEVTEITLTVAGRNEIRCLTQGEAEWQMTAPVGVKADAKEIRSILDALHLLKVAEFTKDGVIDSTEYGIDAPRIRVILQLENEFQELLIGSDIPNTSRIYVKSGAIDSIYAVNREIFSTLDKSVFDLRDKRVIDFQRTATNRFEIQKRGEANIVCVKFPNGDWWIEDPIRLKADAQVVDDILFGVDSLKAVEFVTEQPTNLSRFGLDSPSLQVSFFTPNAEATVFLLGKSKGDNRYAKARNAKRVVLVRGGVLELLSSGVAGLRDKQILDFESDDVFKLSLQHDDVKLTLQKQGVNWRLVSPVQEDAKNGAVNSIIHRLGDLTANEYLASTPSLNVSRLNKPAVQTTVSLMNLKAYTLQVGAANENDQRYARLRAEPDTVFLLEPSIMDELRKTVADFRVAPSAP